LRQKNLNRLMANEWQSYDAAADTHDRLAVPGIFTPPAKDLVASLELPVAGAVLDVGAGSGVAARVAKESSAERTVVALDPSLQMLRVACSHGLCVVVGAVPGLPFRPGTFDGVMANFVLSHLTSYPDALADMARVLRPGGKLGVTSWGSLRNEFRELWQSVADSFAGKEALHAAVEQALPWEIWLEDPAHLRQAFEEAGLQNITLRHTHYTNRMSIADFLAIRGASLQARFMRQTLDGHRWEQFKNAVSAEFYREFEDPIEHMRDVHIAVGTKA
jgi:ubiquinone/menaquinone biosynthesis C-methylase UbiE